MPYNETTEDTVTDMHPFEWRRKFNDAGRDEFVLVNWREITPEEWGLWPEQ